MDLGESLHIWRRRWILTIAMLILALAGTLAALTSLPRVYQSDSTVILLASRSAAKLTGGNPYLSFSPSLTLTADAVSRQLMAPGTARDLAARGFLGAYKVALASDTTVTTGSVLLITVTDSNKAEVEPTLQAVTSEISVRLSQLQASVAPRSQIRTAGLSYSPQATLNASQTARPLVAIAVLGLLAALAIPIAVDGQIARWRIRYGAMVPEVTPDPADEPAYGDRDFAEGTLDYWPPAHNGDQTHRAPRTSR
jgi:hypothetical protein